MRVGPLRLETDLPLARPAPGDGGDLLLVRRGPVDAGGLARDALLLASDADRAVLEVPGVARYEVRGGAVTVDVHPGAPGARVEHHLCGAPLALALEDRGLLALRGGAFLAEGRAWVLTGPPARGTSTVLASLRRAGHPLLGDGWIPLRGTEALPGCPWLELWEGTPELETLAPGGLAPCGPGWARGWWPLGEAWVDRAVPLGGVLTLSELPAARLSASEALGFLGAARVAPARWGPRQRRERFLALTALVRRVPVLRVGCRDWAPRALAGQVLEALPR